MQQDFLEHLLKSKESSDIVKVINIVNEPALNKGENFMSVIRRYKVTVLLNSGETRNIHLIVKSFPEEKEHCIFLEEIAFFKNEIQAYSQVLSKMKALMEEFSDKRDTLWCEMFGFVPYNQIILQDLKELQFYPMDRRKNLDYEHSKYLIKSLARFHAMSAILLKRNSVNVDDFEPYTFAKKKVVKLFFWSYLTTLAKAMETSWGNEWTDFVKPIKQITESVYDKLQELSSVNINRFNVINHGDTWTNNFLFKHLDGTNVPCGLKFLDYQITHYNSFAWDLTYFFYTSILPEIRRAKYVDLITFYHQELLENLKYFKYPNENIPTLTHIMEEMNRIKFYGFLLLTSIYPWTTSETDDPYDVEKALTNEKNPETAINIEIFTCSKYRKMVGNDLKEFIKNDFYINS
uniref:Putative ecdysteroid kinase n=1 Tax=Triatoma infestans TaxID=30076 RepID=A0A023F7F6_TRIIF